MTIRINQTPIDFSLETEQTMGDLVQSVQNWAAGEGQAVVGVLADGKAAAAETPLGGVFEVDFEIVPAEQRDRAKAAVVAEYFELLTSAWGGPASGELQREYGAVRAALFPLFAPLQARMTPALQALDGDWQTPEAALAAALLARVTGARVFELENPGAVLAAKLSELDAAADKAADTGVLFQQGRDKDAFDLILGLFTVVEDTTRMADTYCSSPPQTERWNALQDELQPHLKQTEDALAGGDYVFLSDLLEYEVVPRLREIKAVFPELDPVRDLT